MKNIDKGYIDENKDKGQIDEPDALWFHLSSLNQAIV